MKTRTERIVALEVFFTVPVTVHDPGVGLVPEPVADGTIRVAVVVDAEAMLSVA